MHAIAPRPASPTPIASGNAGRAAATRREPGRETRSEPGRAGRNLSLTLARAAAPSRRRDDAGIGTPAGPGAALEPQVRREMEQRFRHGLGHVRIHTGDAADLSARALGARAFAAGADITFERGAYRPESPDGRKLLAHELAHVVQHGRNGTSRGVSAPGGPAEVEAGRAAARVSDGAEVGPLSAPASEISRQPKPGADYVELEITPGEGGDYTIDVVDPKANAKWIDTALTAAGYNLYLRGFRIWLTGMKVSEWDVGIDIPSSDVDFVTSRARAINNYVYNSRAEARLAVANTARRAGDPLLFAYYWGAGGMVLAPTTICPATAPRATATMWQARQDYARFVQLALAGIAQGIIVGRVLGGLYSWARGGGGGKGEIKSQGKGDEPPTAPKPGATKTDTPEPAPPKPAVTGTAAPKTGPELISQTAKVPGGQAEKVKFFETNKKALEPGWVAHKTGTASDGTVVYHGEAQSKALAITKDGKVFTGTWGKHITTKIDDTGASVIVDWTQPGWKEW